MQEQFSLDLQPKQSAEKQKTLEARYLDLVGVPPRVGFDDVTILAGIADPEAERLRLKEIDATDDKEELKAPYRQKN